MGIFGGLFGRADEKRDVVGDRCNDCGMAEGIHTDWCPTAAAEQETVRPPMEQPETGSAEGPQAQV